MAATTSNTSSTLSLSSTKFPFLIQKHNPFRQNFLFPATFDGRRRSLKLKFSVKAANGSTGSSRSRRKVYKESQEQNQLPIGQFKEIASAVVPSALFIAVSFGNFMFFFLGYCFVIGFLSFGLLRVIPKQSLLPTLCTLLCRHWSNIIFGSYVYG